MRESGRFILAIILMMVVIVGTNIIFGPSQEPVADDTQEGIVETSEGSAAPRGIPPSSLEAGQGGAPRAGDELALSESSGDPTAEGERVEVISPIYRYTFSTRGATVVGAELLGFDSGATDGPVDLVPEGGAGLLGYRLRVGNESVDLRNLDFEVEGYTGPIEIGTGDEPRTIWFTHRDPDSGISARIGYTFSPDDYQVQVEGAIEDGRSSTSRHLLIDLGPTLARHERNAAEDERALAYVVNGVRDGIKSVPLRSVKGERVEEGPLRWVALKNKYFLAAVLDHEIGSRNGAFGGVLAQPTGESHSAYVTTTLPLLESDGSFEYRLYMGPQEHTRLAALGDGMQDVNPYGWKLLRPIIRPLGHLITWALVGLHSTLNLAYGWVLILFGVLIRIILWPLNARAMRSQMRNMALQPRIKEIQEKYKEEPERLQQEMIKLYKEEGFNPLGGCLPMLIPFPILITLFFVFQNTIEFRGTGFLWLSDLSAADPYYILPIVLGLSMLLMQLISTRSMPPNPQTKMLTYIMPVFMTVIFLKLASGLNLYYAAQNLASIPQQLQIAKERRKHQARQAVPAR